MIDGIHRAAALPPGVLDLGRVTPNQVARRFSNSRNACVYADPMNNEDQLSSDIATLENSVTALHGRVEAAGRLAASDDPRVWGLLLALCNDHDCAAALASAAGAALARIAFRLRQADGRIFGEDENFLVRDFSEAAYRSYDTTRADLEPRT